VAVAEAYRAAEVGPGGPHALALLRSERLARGAASPHGEQVETYHDRVRETVALRLPPEVRARYHQRLAAALAFDRAARLYRQALELLPADRPAEDRRRLHERLGEALAGAGQGAAAARESLIAAEGAAPRDALDLRRRAALRLLSSGHIDAGLDALRQVLASAGLSLFGSPRWSFWSLVWQRLRLRLRGLGYRLRAADEVPADLLAQFDVCETASIGLSMVDTIQGAYFQTRSLRLALRAGEPVRLATALAVEACHESIGGTANRARTGTLLSAADQLARELGQPYPQAMVAMARGIAAALAGDWAQGLALCDEAEGILREHCHGVRWELGTAHRFALWPLVFLGRLGEVARRLPGLIQEARERDDLYGETNLCLMVRTTLRLAQDEPARARQELGELMGRWSHQGFHVQHMNRLYDDTQIDLYEGDGAAAWRRLAAAWPTLQRSKLLLVQQVRIFMGHLRGRAALAAGASADMLREAEREARALSREGAAWATALEALLRAGAAARRGRRDEALALLREGEGRCESAGLGLYAAAARWWRDDGRADAEAWMHGQGVRQPGRLAAMMVPGL
jgi:hypothetical protein